jgi:hypothetical protein
VAVWVVQEINRITVWLLAHSPVGSPALLALLIVAVGYLVTRAVVRLIGWLVGILVVAAALLVAWRLVAP